MSIRHPGLKCGKKIACTEERLRELHTEHLAGRSLASIGKEVGLTAQGVWAAFNSRDWELTGGRRLGWERREVRSG